MQFRVAFTLRIYHLQTDSFAPALSSESAPPLRACYIIRIFPPLKQTRLHCLMQHDKTRAIKLVIEQKEIHRKTAYPLLLLAERYSSVASPEKNLRSLSGKSEYSSGFSRYIYPTFWQSAVTRLDAKHHSDSFALWKCFISLLDNPNFIFSCQQFSLICKTNMQPRSISFLLRLR